MPSGQPMGTRITWNDAMDRKLLLAIIKQYDSNPDMTKVAAEMGEGITKMAVGQRFSKLKKMVAEGTDTSTTETPKSGAKRAAKKSASETKSGSKRKAASKAASEEDDGLGHDDEEATPSKKVKKEASPALEGEDDELV